MNQSTTIQESKGFYKLSWLQRIGFGSGDLAQNLIFQVICTYLLFFYTDIYGLTPSAVACHLGSNSGRINRQKQPTLRKIPFVSALCGHSTFWIRHFVFLQRFRTFFNIRIRYIYFYAIALYVYQRAIRSIELFAYARHQRNHHTYFSTYVYGKSGRLGC